MTQQTDWPRIAVMGAGAVGCYFGGMLARAGAPVTLIGRRTTVETIARDGLFIDSIHFQERVAVQASTEIAASRDSDLVLFSVKSPDTEDTARQRPPRESAIARVSSWFETAGVPCRVSSHVDVDLWTRLIVNADRTRSPSSCRSRTARSSQLQRLAKPFVRS